MCDCSVSRPGKVQPGCSTDLIGAPVPGGLHGESEHKAGPRQVSCDRVPEEVEGVCPRLVASLVDVGGDGRDGLHVEVLESFVASDLVES